VGNTKTWTDDQLRAAVAIASSLSAVLRALKLKPGSRRYIQDQIRRLGIDASHFKTGNEKQLCTDEQLRELVQTSRTTTEILQKLGVEQHSNNFYKVRRRIGLLDLDTSHFVRARSENTDGYRRWTDDDLERAVAASQSYAQTIRALGLVPAGGNYDAVQRKIRELGIDTSHFNRTAWNKGKQGFVPVPPLPLERVLVAGRWTSSHGLKMRLIREGLKQAACELCGWAERTPDGRIPIELDHINGDKNDNRLENLRILCPNCHSLQPTHRGLNQRKAIQRRNEVRLPDVIEDNKS
jgi:hypothetical protein